jgi:hypothetical protein
MMLEAAGSPFSDWENFYVNVRSSAAALTGLQFVVITLISEVRSRRNSSMTIDAFSTPTVVHFCAALLISVTLSAPWPTLHGAALMIGAAGIFGVVYSSIVLRRATSQSAYKLVTEDWIWHVILPFFAYGTLIPASITLTSSTHVSLFAIAASALVLVFIGIHNAWDTTTFVASNPELFASMTDNESDGRVPTAVDTAPAAPTATAEPR